MKINYIADGDNEAWERTMKSIIKSVNDSLNKQAPKTSGYVMDTLSSVLWSIRSSSSWQESILTAVNLGMDADTVGSITGALGALIYPEAVNIKIWDWVEELENLELIEGTLKGIERKMKW